jgi:hypothetical protein
MAQGDSWYAANKGIESGTTFTEEIAVNTDVKVTSLHMSCTFTGNNGGAYIAFKNTNTNTLYTVGDPNEFYGSILWQESGDAFEKKTETAIFLTGDLGLEFRVKDAYDSGDVNWAYYVSGVELK